MKTPEEVMKILNQCDEEGYMRAMVDVRQELNQLMRDLEVFEKSLLNIDIKKDMLRTVFIRMNALREKSDERLDELKGETHEV